MREAQGLAENLLLLLLGLCSITAHGQPQGEAPAFSHNVVWMAPFLTGGGYSSEAISYAVALQALLPAGRLGAVQFAEQMDHAFARGLPDATLRGLQAQMRRATAHFRVGSIAVCHSTPDLWVPSIFAGWDSVAPCPPRGSRYAIGRTMYETDGLPPTWAARCNALDEVWVPTEFHREVFAKSGVARSKLVVVPEATDTAFFDPAAHAPLALPDLPPLAPAPAATAAAGDGAAAAAAATTAAAAAAAAAAVESDFLFLSVFKWERRKGWDVLLEAFLAEFRPWERAVLVIKTRPFYSEDDDFAGLVRRFAADKHQLGAAAAAYAGDGGGGVAAAAPRILVLDQEIPQRELPRLYAAADAFVLPSRGEGWGRPHAEAMSMGLPAIATNWSGPTAFMNERNSYPVEVEALVPVPEGHAGHRWAQPSVAHLRARMRHVFEHREEARAVGRRARRDMVEHFSPAPVAEIVFRRLQEVQRKLLARDEVHQEL